MPTVYSKDYVATIRTDIRIFEKVFNLSEGNIIRGRVTVTPLIINVFNLGPGNFQISCTISFSIPIPRLLSGRNISKPSGKRVEPVVNSMLTILLD